MSRLAKRGQKWRCQMRGYLFISLNEITGTTNHFSELLFFYPVRKIPFQGKDYFGRLSQFFPWLDGYSQVFFFYSSVSIQYATRSSNQGTISLDYMLGKSSCQRRIQLFWFTNQTAFCIKVVESFPVHIFLFSFGAGSAS